MPGQVAQVFGLAARQAAGGKRVQLQGGDVFRANGLREFGKARPDAVGGLDRNLLADDGAREGLEGIAAIGEDGVGITFDERGHHRVGCGEFGAGLLPISRVPPAFSQQDDVVLLLRIAGLDLQRHRLADEIDELGEAAGLFVEEQVDHALRGDDAVFARVNWRASRRISRRMS